LEMLGLGRMPEFLRMLRFSTLPKFMTMPRSLATLGSVIAP
jgi:hypothetical protein